MSDLVRFEDRILGTDDDGLAFEDFVHSSLAQDKSNPNLLKRLARGRDGAIDMITDSSGETVVVECKFIGRDTKSDAFQRWNEVKKHLQDNLPKLALDHTLGQGSPYRRWLDIENPVTGYWFCVSSPLTENAAIGLRGAIQAFFQTLAQGSSLAHLERLAAPNAVRIVSWDHFARDLVRFPALKHRWFGGLPDGLQPLDLRAKENGGFRRYLQTGGLPYYSRELFSASKGRPAVTTEAGLVDSLEGDDPVRSLILFGPGGVGKSRLSLELGRSLFVKGWDVYRLTNLANARTVDELLRAHEAPAQIVLILDYAETANSLGNIAQAIEGGAVQGGHRLRLIVNCRKSSLFAVHQSLAEMLPRRYELAGDAGEKEFAVWATEQILLSEGIPETASVLTVCKGLPAMAAFAVYVHRADATSFNLQFSALNDDPSFQSWVNRRVTMLCRDRGSPSAVRRALGKLALSLPISDQRLKTILEGYPEASDLLEALQVDRWIERNENEVSAAHDILADGLAAQWFLDDSGEPTSRLSDSLHQLASDGALPNALVAIDRLASNPGFSKIDGKAVVSRLLTSNQSETLGSALTLLRGGLLDLRSKAALLSENELFRNAVVASPASDVVLAFLVRRLSELPQDEQGTYETTGIVRCLDTAASRPSGSNYLLRCAYQFLPDRYRERLIDRIHSEPTQSQTHFLLVALLDGGEVAAALDREIAVWLGANASFNAKCSFVFEAWLVAGGEPDFVRDAIRVWLGTHQSDTEAQFVYKAWLDATGERDFVREPIRAWLGTHQSDAEARFVYQAWLDAKGEVDFVREPIRAWLSTHHTDAEATRIYKAWLDAKGERQPIRESIGAWLGAHQSDAKAQFVYKAWLDAKGERDVVRESIGAWLAAHQLDAEAQFVYKAWLDAGGERDFVREPIRAWLGIHKSDAEAQFVYQAWLDAKGELDLVHDQTVDWLRSNVETTGFDFVLRTWLEAGGGIEPVRDGAIRWLHDNRENRNAVFVAKPLSKLTDLPLDSVVDIAIWAYCFPDDEDAIFRLSAVARVCHVETTTEHVLSIIARVAIRVLMRVPSSRMDDEPTIAALAFMFGNLFSSSYIGRVHGTSLDFVFSRYVSSGRLFHRSSHVETRSWIVIAIHRSLRAGFFDPRCDMAGLIAYTEWLSAKAADDVSAMSQVDQILAFLALGGIRQAT